MQVLSSGVDSRSAGQRLYGRPAADACYYVRARQEDGHRVWLSAFWVQQ
jgi:hypothetical protein